MKQDPITTLRRAGIVAGLPRFVRAFGYRMLGPWLDRRMWRAEYETVLSAAKRVVPGRGHSLGIVKDIMLRHSYYEAACLELGVPYKLLDIVDDGWRTRFEHADSSVFLVRPFVLTRAGKALYDERASILCREMKKKVFPSFLELWLYESKIRQAEWLKQESFPTPMTWVFRDRAEAMLFVKTSECVFRPKPDTHSDSIRTPVPKLAGHLFR